MNVFFNHLVRLQGLGYNNWPLLLANQLVTETVCFTKHFGWQTWQGSKIISAQCQYQSKAFHEPLPSISIMFSLTVSPIIPQQTFMINTKEISKKTTLRNIYQPWLDLVTTLKPEYTKVICIVSFVEKFPSKTFNPFHCQCKLWRAIIIF